MLVFKAKNNNIIKGKMSRSKGLLIDNIEYSSSLVAHWFWVTGIGVLILVGEKIFPLSFFSRNLMIDVYLQTNS